MRTLCFKYTILILLLFSVGTINAQLINKKEFRLKDTKPGIIELNKNYDLTSKISVTEK